MGDPGAVVEKVVADFHVPVIRMLLRRHPDGGDTVDVRFAVTVSAEKIAAIADACRGIEGAASVSVAMPGLGGH
jgi:hypothetical protein